MVVGSFGNSEEMSWLSIVPTHSSFGVCVYLPEVIYLFWYGGM